MLIGAMNHPAQDILSEMRWMADMKLGFIDLTLEPPLAAAWLAEPKRILDAAKQYNLAVVGHTAYYLPIASAFETLRRAAVEELKRCLEIFAAVGAKWMNIHPDGKAPLHADTFHIGRNLESLKELDATGRNLGVGLMIENLPGKFNTVAQLSALLDAMPELGLHLDIGHCNLMVEQNTADDLINRYGHRLKHVHMHDNKGGYADLHLPLGCGNIDNAHYVRVLKGKGYDGTITLEVFSEDRTYLEHSRDVLQQLWDAA